MNKPVKITSEYLATRKEVADKMSRIKEFDQEVCLMVTLSPDYRIIGDHLITIGGFYEASVPVNVLLNRVISDKSNMFIIGHNHPTGVGIPSQADIMTVLNLLLIGDMMDIHLLDSLIFPYNQKHICIRSLYPNLWKKQFFHNVNDILLKYVPKKVREDVN